MRLRQLFEDAVSEVAIIFGRFNPPHKGHKAAWELASKSPVWYVGTNESTVGPKDPLPYDVKVEAMKTIWPEVESHIVAETGWLTLASKVYQQYPDATLLCLTDEDWVTKTIQQYNGKEGPHGFYNFKNIEQKPTPRLSSATALRDAVTNGDRDAFSAAAGVDADTPVAGKPFFDLVAEYLLPYANAPKKVVKKKAAPVEGVAEDVEEEEPGQHRVAVKITDPNTYDDVQRVVRVHANDEQDAIDKAEAFYAKKGIYIVSIKYIGMAKMAEGAPIVVAQAPIDVRNPKKAPQPYRNKGDIVPDTKPPSTEKRGVKGRPGQRPMPTYEGAGLSVGQLATISDEALDKAYGYGRSSPGNTFGWQANLKSAAYAKQMIDKGVTDIEAISDAIHKGWNVTAKAFVTNPDQFDDTEKLRASGKLDAKLQQREKLMNIAYAQLSDEEQEKDRVVARALLTAIKGQGVAEAGIDTGNMPVVRLGGTVAARPAVKVGSLVKAQGLDGVWRVDQVRGDNASITMERPNTGVSRNIPVSALRVWTNKPITPLRNGSMSERVRDPEDWDEGNTEPGNNFAVYINGKKWKVFPGPYGAYADSPEERREFQRLKDMAERKSQQTGKKWEVYITGEPATR
jgi:hypothetical protein